jgi:hypothetical protein
VVVGVSRVDGYVMVVRGVEEPVLQSCSGALHASGMLPRRVVLVEVKVAFTVVEVRTNCYLS